MERFASKPGVVIVKGYTVVGSVVGSYDGTIEVDATDLWNPHDSVHTRGVVLDLATSTTLGTAAEHHSSFIDYDEIEPLLQGLDYIARADPSVTRLKNFEVSYRTLGDLIVTTFNDSRGRTMASVRSGEIGGVQVFLEAQRLEKLRTLIAAARATLDSLAPKRGA
jgi:hypothetical protein